jgi:methanogenic corrinoid protein MtbC1
VSDIGTDVPAQSFADAVRNVDQLTAVCVGVTMRESLTAAQESVAAIRNAVANDVKVFVGGAAVDSEDVARSLGADAWARDPRTLLALLASQPVD